MQYAVAVVAQSVPPLEEDEDDVELPPAPELVEVDEVDVEVEDVEVDDVEVEVDEDDVAALPPAPPFELEPQATAKRAAAETDKADHKSCRCIKRI